MLTGLQDMCRLPIGKLASLFRTRSNVQSADRSHLGTIAGEKALMGGY